MRALKLEKPDIVILDVEMPVMTGLEALRKIRETDKRTPVIMFSTLTERGATITLDALNAGANDYVPKPSGAADLNAAMAEVEESLLTRIRALCGAKKRCSTLARSHKVNTRDGNPAKRIDVVVMASSTGGPTALQGVLPKLPANFPVPILLVQHMPAVFTKNLAMSLDKKCALEVQEAHDGAIARPGQVWIAPGGYHMELRREGTELRIVTHEGPLEQSVRPCADILFRSAAKLFGAHTLGVVLTGMGYDGRNGADALQKAGGHVFAQDEESSTVWGMPGGVVEANLADKILTLADVAPAIVSRATTGRSLIGGPA